MNLDTLIRDLKRLSVETGSLTACKTENRDGG